MSGNSVTEYKLLVAGEWVDGNRWEEITAPYDGSVIARVAIGDADLVGRAVKSARSAFDGVDFPQYERAAVLDRAASLLTDRVDDFARMICLEAGKPIKQARAEAQRAVSTLTFSAVECRKLTGESVPMDASTAGVGKTGFIMRVPVGVVGAITPFNFPLNLVCHKIGPAIAAGCPIVQKPAGQTPLSSLMLAELLLEAGLPDTWLSVVCGSGSEVGGAIVEHPDVAMITFTGSVPVGWGIRAKVPHKRVSLELGSTAPLIVNGDGDWETAADKAGIHAYSHAGQSCISIQRIFLHESVADSFLDRFLGVVRSLKVGDPLDAETDVGPVIDADNRDRVVDWIDEARTDGAEVLAGGEVGESGLLMPTVIKNPSFKQKVVCQEVFGPVVTVHTFSDFEEALRLANDSDYGLQAGVFTSDIGDALKAAHTLEFGGVLINEVPTFRADQQPYGGIKDSGNTREGPAYAIREMTEERFVSLQG